MIPRWFFGIDGGGTRSRIAVVDADLQVIARAEAGSTNLFSTAPEAVYRTIETLLNEVLGKVSLKPGDLAGGCIGSAGLNRPAETARFREFFIRLLGDGVPVKLVTDGEILLVGGLQALEGFCLISGTGSLALGRSADGTVVRAGGLGHQLGDEGSAWWIGHEAVSRSLRSAEGRDLPTDMLVRLTTACGLDNPGEFVGYVHHRASKADIAALAPLVTEAAGRGDLLAVNILERAAEELALMASSVMRRLAGTNSRRLAAAGGVMEHDAFVRSHLQKLLKTEYPSLEIIEPLGTALEGACRLAVEHVRAGR
jgi:glucosamine kinase